MAWWDEMPKRLQLILALAGTCVGLLGGAFALGAATRETLDGHRDLPQRVSALESRVETLDARLSEQLGEIQCILRAQAEDRSAASCLHAFGGTR